MIFIDNKYTHWYYNIITNAQSRTPPLDVYTEKHHVIPKSLGGSNAQNNLVTLTAREHFLCHWMLTKMTSGESKKSMIFALRMLRAASTKHQRHNTLLTARVYESIRKVHSAYLSATLKGRVVSDATKEKMSVAAKNKTQNPFKGKTHTDDTKLAIGNANRGKKRTLEQRQKMSENAKNISDTTREKLSIYKKEHPLSEDSLNKIRKQYVVTHPDGQIETISNITEFCSQHHLSLPAMRDNVAKGKQEHHKGFRIKPILKI